MNKLQMNSAWHIQNLIEQDDDCQVVTMHDANVYVNKLEADNDKLEADKKDLQARLVELSNSTLGRVADLELALGEISQLSSCRQDESCCIALAALDKD